MKQSEILEKIVYNLYYNTVTPLLHEVLKDLMQENLFDPFRLVGGTALSLQKGHRFSDDIDMFTDLPYNSLNFGPIYHYFQSKYKYVKTNNILIDGMGRSYTVGESDTVNVKVDLFYTDHFIRDYLVIDGIRMATSAEIIAMKLDVVQRIGRKKDFWDIHELTIEFTMEQMLALHEERHPYTHDREAIKSNFINFENADTAPDPTCLRGKYWELIKTDLVDFVKK